MIKYILKRVCMALITIVVVSMITFFFMNLMPGGPFDTEKVLSDAAKAAMEAKFGLDKPVIVQYFIYMGNLITGDFGPSMKLQGWEVIGIIKVGLKNSATMGGCAALIAITCGLILGSIAALNHNKWGDRVIMVLSTMSVAMPSFIMGTLLLFAFGVKIPVFPTRYNNIDVSGLILPIITLALYPMAYITRLTRSSMLDALSQDYIRTAKAKGVLKRKVIFKHALRNAVSPVVTYAGPMVAYILTGSLVIEKIFSVSGLGEKFISAIQNRDYTVIMGITMFLATIMVTMNLISDILYKLFDPRVSFS